MEKALFRLGWVSGESVVPFFMGCLVFVMAKKAAALTWPDEAAHFITGRKGICEALNAALFAALTVLGYLGELYQGSPLRRLFDICVTFAGLFFLFAVFLYYAYELADGLWSRQRKLDEKRDPAPKTLRNFFIYSLIVFLGFLPLFLRFYPGSFGADSINQVRQALHLAPYTNHLPVLSTWLIELFYNMGFSLTGDVNAGLAFYTVFQMIITAFTYAACICYLEKCGIGAPLRYILLACFAFTPAIGMYAFYIHKDTPAADLLLLLIIYLHYYVNLDKSGKKNPGVKDHVLFGLLGILFMLFRSNHYFVYIGLFVCAVFAFKNMRRAVLIVMAVGIIISALFKGPVLGSMDIHGTDAAETLSMPLVMVAYTAKVGGEFSQKDAEVIDRILPRERLAEVYSEVSANPVKKTVRSEGDNEFFNENKVLFMKTFLSVFVKNPVACTIALADHSKGYYCPKFSYPELILGVWENDFGAFTQPVLDGSIGQKVYESAQLFYDTYEKYLGCAMSFWLVLFLMFYALYKGKSVLPYMPVIGIVATLLLASPNVGRFRYQYPIMVASLLLVGITLAKEKVISKEKKHEGKK